MKILFDQGVPAPLRKHLLDHEVTTAAELDWSQLTNGELISRADANGFECLVTTDQNLKYQQNLSQRSIALVVLLSTSWPRMRDKANHVVQAIESVEPAGYVEVPI